MDAALVNNPDGSAAVVVPAGVAQTSPANAYREEKSNPEFKIQTNPFPEHDRVAMENLQIMQKQDAAAWAAHPAADPVSLKKQTRRMAEKAPLLLLCKLTLRILLLFLSGAFQAFSAGCCRYSVS